MNNMIKIKKTVLIGFTFVFPLMSWSQTSLQTDAERAYSIYESALEQDDLNITKVEILKAKALIDKVSSENELSKDPKSLYYKGIIYSTIQMIRYRNDSEFNSQTPENAMSIATYSFHEAFTKSNSFDKQIGNFITTLVDFDAKNSTEIFKNSSIEKYPEIYNIKLSVDARYQFDSYCLSFSPDEILASMQNLLKARNSFNLISKKVKTDSLTTAITLFLEGDLYTAIHLLRIYNDSNFNSTTTSNTLDLASSAYSKAFAIAKKINYKSDFQSLNSLLIGEVQAKTFFENKEYSKSAETYKTLHNLSELIGRNGTTYIYSAAIAYHNGNDLPNAGKYYLKSAELTIKPEDNYVRAAQIYLSLGQKEETIRILKTAIDKYPENKTLNFYLGTIYMESGNDNAATNSLKKAIAIDPKFWDAQYQLGAHLSNIGSKKRNEANALKLNDPNFDKMIAQSDEYYKQAIIPLEIYISEFPNDKPVLNSLHQIYRALKNTEKALEYKKRLDAAE